MAEQPPTRAPRRTSLVLIAFAALCLLAVTVLVGAWAYLSFLEHSTAGLEGTWRVTNDTSHRYEFRPNGDLACWFGPKEWWSRLGWSATWQRDGTLITVRTDRNWDFEGELDGATIRGKMLMRDETGAVVNKTDMVWQKE